MAEHFTKEIGKIVVAEGSFYPKTSRVVIEPTEWSHTKPSDHSDFESPRSMRSSKLHSIVPQEFTYIRDDP